MPISVINDYVSNDLLLWKLSEKEIQLNNLVNLSLSSKSRLDLIKSSILQLICDIKLQKKMSIHGQKIIDGKGLSRVTKEILNLL